MVIDMKYLKRNGKTILTAIVELLAGILLFIDAEGFTTVILIGTGVVLLVSGVVCFVRYFQEEPVRAALEQNLFKGLMMVLVGVFLVFWTKNVMNLFPDLVRLYGVVVLIIGLWKFQQSVDLLRVKASYWFVEGLNALLALLFAALILAMPLAYIIVLRQISAISLIIQAILDLVVMILTGKGPKQDESL